MLTLKEHYKDVLEGKDESELKIYSLDLRPEMNQLKYDIERSNGPDFKAPKRSKLSKVNKYRLYLRETYRAIEKIGGIVKRPEEDLIAAEFQENIPYIQKINYSIGGFLGGFDNYEVTFEKDRVEVSKEKTGDDWSRSHDNELMVYYRNHKKEKMSQQEFLKTIKRLHMGEWHHSYLSDDYGITVLDGASWGVEVYYSNKQNKFECGGVNAYPYNFHEFNRLMEKAFEAYHRNYS